MRKKGAEKTERISTMLSPETVKLLNEEAKIKGLTVSGFIRMLILDYFTKAKKKT